MVRFATIEDAKLAVAAWGGAASSIIHLGDRGNSVFSFINARGKLQILRMTDPEFRSRAEVNAEIEFINRIFMAGVPVAKALPALNGDYTILVECAVGNLICSSIAFAPGVEVLEGSPYWDSEFFCEWGRNLALIHHASASSQLLTNSAGRWHWDREILIVQAESLIPADDTKSLQEFHEVMNHCQKLAKIPGTYGLIHADHASQNFRFDVATKVITAFDFGNCCFHWFVADIAISLSTVRRKANRDQIKQEFLSGYQKVRPLPPKLDELLDLFIRLRVVYVYLSRLHLWSDDRTPKQAQELEIIKLRVHDKQGW